MERDVNRMLLRNIETCYNIGRLASLQVVIYRGDSQDVVFQLLDFADASADDSASNSYDTVTSVCRGILQQLSKIITTPVNRLNIAQSLGSYIVDTLEHGGVQLYRQ